MNDRPLVVLEWMDAWCRGDHAVTLADVGALHHPEPITTIGWVLMHDDTGIMLANEWYSDGFRGLTFVPAGMISSVQPYRLTKAPKPRSKAVPPTPT